MANLATHAAKELIREGDLVFSMTQDWAAKMKAEGHMHLSTLTREVGAGGRYILNFTKVPAESMVNYVVEFAYLNGLKRLTHLITARVATLLERYVEQGDETGCFAELGWAKWANARENKVVFRL
jgi:hypothetical protein